jgi:hypothetical protein
MGTIATLLCHSRFYQKKKNRRHAQIIINRIGENLDGGFYQGVLNNKTIIIFVINRATLF